MKICMIAEGCYPYVVGGVSGWIQMMINGLSEHEFSVFTIAVDESQRGQFKYDLPENLKEVHENFLLSSPDKKGRRKRKIRQKNRIDAKKAEELSHLVMSDGEIPWKDIYETVRSDDFDVDSYLTGYDFFDAAKARYIRDGVSTGFSDYLWTLRSMLTPLFVVLGSEIPEADIYHSVSAGYAGIVGALGAVIYGKPFILSEHGIYTREREEELIRSKWTQGYFKEMWIRQFYTLSQFAYEQADVVVSLFEKNADIQKELGCPPEKIQIIPNGVSPEDYADIDWKHEVEGGINVGAVIRVTPIKDIKTMISAYKEVQNQLPDTKFFILGPYDEDKEYYQECLDMISQLELKNTELPGRVNIKEYLPQMDIMTLTSISEGQPLAILEGMMFHKPWVTTNVGSCAELMNGRAGDDFGPAGLVAPVMDVRSISKAIVKLASDERLRVDMGEAGFNRANKFYRRDDMFNSYRDIYTALGGE